MDRVIVTRPIMGLCAMQVCAVADATDEEILLICNRQNPSGTTAGWSRVVRSLDPDRIWIREDMLPVPCGGITPDDEGSSERIEGRVHFLVTC